MRSRPHRSLPLALLAFALLGSPGCGLGPRVLLVVDLQTDIAPRLEFVSIRVRANGEESSRDVEPGEEFYEGRRAAELRVSPGTVRVSVELLDQRDQVRAERTMIVQVRTDTAIIVPISGLCRGVICDNPDETCIRGSCVRADSICAGMPCDTETECPGGVCSRECDLDDECDRIDPCSTPRCVSRVCVGVPEADACGPSFYCSSGRGCLSIPPGSGLDGGVLPDGAIPDGAILDGGDGSVGPTTDAGTCGTCMAVCGTTGTYACGPDGGVTGPCIPPLETCEPADEDCDGRIDEGLACDHTHGVLLQVSTAMMSGSLSDTVSVGTPGLVCAGGLCGPNVVGRGTLPGGGTGHTHGYGGGFSVGPASGWVSVSGSTEGHSVTCRIAGSTGTTAYYNLDDPMVPATYNKFCLTPTGPCGTTFGPCTAR